VKVESPAALLNAAHNHPFTVSTHSTSFDGFVALRVSAGTEGDCAPAAYATGYKMGLFALTAHSTGSFNFHPSTFNPIDAAEAS
jgi:hypothetical protein